MPKSRQVGAHADGKGDVLREAKGINNSNQKYKDQMRESKAR